MTWKMFLFRMTFPFTLILVGLDLVLALAPAASAQSRFPRFDRVLLLETTSETSANIALGDLNGDGNLDILLVKGRHWPLKSRVLLGDGRGNFPTACDLGNSPHRSYSGRLVDIDGDGDLDVVLSNDAPDPKVVYMNDGKGHFRLGSTYGQPKWETRNANVADLNGDGRPDIIVANRSDKNPGNYICLNKGKGRFDSNCVLFSRESATTITPADFNHDRLIDLAVPNRDGGQSYVYLGDAKAAYSNLRRVSFGPADASMRMAEAADFNGDGLLDIVTIDEKRGVAIYFGQKDRTFSAGTALDSGGATPYALAVRDLNGDGRIDIVVGNVEAPSTTYFNDVSGPRGKLSDPRSDVGNVEALSTIYFNNSLGRGQVSSTEHFKDTHHRVQPDVGRWTLDLGHWTSIHFGDNKGVVYGFAIADLDRDGLLDIAVARSDAPNAIYFASAGPAATP